MPTQSTSPSYVISHGGLAGIRVRMRGETTWSGTLPLEDQLPHYKQHFVVQVRKRMMNMTTYTKTFEVFGLNYDTVFEDGGQIIFLHIYNKALFFECFVEKK